MKTRTQRVELGSHYSQYDVTPAQQPQLSQPWTGPGASFIHDPVVTELFNLARFWEFRAEGQFRDGFGSSLAHGFYLNSNPQGLKPRTNLRVLRTVWHC